MGGFYLKYKNILNNVCTYLFKTAKTQNWNVLSKF